MTQITFQQNQSRDKRIVNLVRENRELRNCLKLARDELKGLIEYVESQRQFDYVSPTKIELMERFRKVLKEQKK